MYKYSKTSKSRLASCHSEMQRLFNSLIEDYDVSIICGHRDEMGQNQAITDGASKTEYPNSKHNQYPSRAIDAALYPINWNDHGRHYMFVGIVRERARQLGIKIRCGADWDGDFATNDQTFHDLVHFEYAGDL